MSEMPEHVRKQFEIRRKLDAIAPLPDDRPPTAIVLARHLAVRAAERNVRQLDPRVPFDGLQIAAMTAEFAAAHALVTLAEGGSGDEAAAQIADAWDDGGEIGEWLYQHLGEQTVNEVSALAGKLTDAEAAAAS
jgi:hypothetical protein